MMTRKFSCLDHGYETFTVGFFLIFMAQIFCIFYFLFSFFFMLIFLPAPLLLFAITANHHLSTVSNHTTLPSPCLQSPLYRRHNKGLHLRIDHGTAGLHRLTTFVGTEESIQICFATPYWVRLKQI